MDSRSSGWALAASVLLVLAVVVPSSAQSTAAPHGSYLVSPVGRACGGCAAAAVAPAVGGPLGGTPAGVVAVGLMHT